METRADQIFEAFKRFHANNPGIWALFDRFTGEVVKSERPHYSASAIIERIRWHVDIETAGSEVKINNNFVAYYARMFEAKNPRHMGFFQKRKRISEAKEAHPNDVQVFNSGDAGDEMMLFFELKDL